MCCAGSENWRDINNSNHKGQLLVCRDCSAAVIRCSSVLQLRWITASSDPPAPVNCCTSAKNKKTKRWTLLIGEMLKKLERLHTVRYTHIRPMPTLSGAPSLCRGWDAILQNLGWAHRSFQLPVVFQWTPNSLPILTSDINKASQLPPNGSVLFLWAIPHNASPNSGETQRWRTL